VYERINKKLNSNYTNLKIEENLLKIVYREKIIR